jgi:ABC-type transport system substrate-binding protein
MAFDSIPAVEALPGGRLMSLPGGPEYIMHIYGNYHVEALAGTPQPAYDPNLPWVSASADLDSEEWLNAVKVRQAMIYAIDRETIIETILGGFARPGLLWTWAHNEHRLEGRSWEYNPDRARELLAEAGYSGGFRITLAPAIRGAPAEVEACEAIATMWNNELGLNVNFQRVPYDTLRPQFIGRTFQGVMCNVSPQTRIVGPAPQLTTQGVSNWGVSHPYLEELVPQIASAVDDADREQLENQVGAFLFDHALTAVSLYVGESVWPVGPKIEPWLEHVHTRDLRVMNGYEYIQPRP